MQANVYIRGSATTNSCEDITRKYTSSLYSGINAWNWNTECNLNNNNRNNSLTVWPFLELRYTEDALRNSAISLDEWWAAYRRSRKGKMSKAPQVRFALQSTSNLYEIAYNVGTYSLKPEACTLFVLKKPKIREVIAAAVPDKIIQSYYVKSLRPYIQQFIPQYSCSCQIRKGGLYAVKRASELIKKYPNGYIFKLDLQNCFPSFDTEFWVNKLSEVLQEILPEGEKKDMLLYLTKVLYLSRPQDGVKIECGQDDLILVEPEKSLLTKSGYTGLAIGNEASQFLVNFATAYLLRILEQYNIEYVHYTDDTLGVIPDLYIFTKMLPEYINIVNNSYHFTVHPKKRYIQPTKHGVPFLSAFISGNGAPFPSKRIIHNGFERLRLFIQWAEKDRQWMLSHIQHIADSLNSYLALTRHYHSYKLRQKFCKSILNSILSEVIYADPIKCLKVVVRSQYRLRNRCTVKNKRYRHYIYNLIYHAN